MNDQIINSNKLVKEHLVINIPSGTCGYVGKLLNYDMIETLNQDDKDEFIKDIRNLISLPNEILNFDLKMFMLYKSLLYIVENTEYAEHMR